MATCYRLGILQFVPHWRQEVLFSPHFSVLALRPTKPPLSGCCGCFPGFKWLSHDIDHTHPHVGVRLRVNRIAPILCLCASYGILQGDLLPYGYVKVSHLCFVIWQYSRQMSTAVTFASFPLIFWLSVSNKAWFLPLLPKTLILKPCLTLREERRLKEGCLRTSIGTQERGAAAGGLWKLYKG
jgi:hypothetical protein